MTDTPGDAALRRVVEEMREARMARWGNELPMPKHPWDGMAFPHQLDEWITALEANTRHTPEGRGWTLPKVLEWARDCDASIKRRIEAHLPATPGNEAMGTALMQVGVVWAAIIPMLEQALANAAPQSGAPVASVHCAFCPRIGLKQGHEMTCPGIAPAPHALSAEEREALREALGQEFSHKAMDTIAALLAGAQGEGATPKPQGGGT